MQFRRQLCDFQGELHNLHQELLSSQQSCDRLTRERNCLREDMFSMRRASDEKDNDLADCKDLVKMKVREARDLNCEVDQLQQEMKQADLERQEVKRELIEVQEQARVAKGQMKEFEDALQVSSSVYFTYPPPLRQCNSQSFVAGYSNRDCIL